MRVILQRVERGFSYVHEALYIRADHREAARGGDEKEELKKTARYGARAPLALSRLTYDRELDLVSYTYTNPYDTCEYTEKITPHELIVRLTIHILDRWEHTTRYAGFYANRSRGKRKRDHRAREGAEEEREARASTHWRWKWAELLRLVFEVNLACPRCGTEMKILSFVTETEPIHKILVYMKEKGIDARAGPFADSAA